MSVAAFASTTIIGFDSAWANRQQAPGAVCALVFDALGESRFEPPRLAGFEAAADFVEKLHDTGRKTLVAIDQPTIVPNGTGMRCCEKVVASIISWTGGGIQPANRGKKEMFGDEAPIWRFLKRLGFADDPGAIGAAKRGGFVLEVFPALALLEFDAGFAALRGGPRYNPARRKTFRQDAWRAVCDAVAKRSGEMAFEAVAGWCRMLDGDMRPGKPEQDMLDSVICLLVAALWLAQRDRCLMVGDIASGYIIAPVGPDIRLRLMERARRNNVPFA